MYFFFGTTHKLMSGTQLFLIVSGLVFYAILTIIRVRRLTDEKQKRHLAIALRNAGLAVMFTTMLIAGALVAFNMFYPIFFVPFVLVWMGFTVINLLTYWYLQR